MQSHTFPAKILLFGEYSIIRGSRALAVPFRDFGGRWAYSGSGMMCSDLLNLAAWLEDLDRSGKLLAPLDMARFGKDLERGLYFDCDIPMGYGLGSSGALVAAVFHYYGPGEGYPLSGLKEALAQIENFFHGSSSGIDPMVCLLGRPLLLKEGRQPEIVEIPAADPSGRGGLFLLDTGISRETGPLVRTFLGKCEDLAFDALVEDELGPLTDEAIDAFLRGDWQALPAVFKAISSFQWNHFREMIPAEFMEIWKEGLDSPVFHLKLCGAGGGGFLLGLAPDFQAAGKELAPFGIRPLHPW